MKISNTHHKTVQGIVKRNPIRGQHYKVVFDAGIPYENYYSSESALKEGLEIFYLKHKDADDDFDIKVYTKDQHNKEIDITEGQMVQEIIAKIIDEE